MTGVQTCALPIFDLQQFQSQQVEIEAALEELASSEEAYKIVGAVMIRTGKEELIKDLASKKEMIEIRIKAIERQESQLRDKATKLQEEVLRHIKK